MRSPIVRLPLSLGRLAAVVSVPVSVYGYVESQILAHPLTGMPVPSPDSNSALLIFRGGSPPFDTVHSPLLLLLFLPPDCLFLLLLSIVPTLNKSEQPFNVPSSFPKTNLQPIPRPFPLFSRFHPLSFAPLRASMRLLVHAVSASELGTARVRAALLPFLSRGGRSGRPFALWMVG